MALVEIRKLRAGTFLGLWRIEESEEEYREQLWLDDEEMAFLASISHESRRLQWLASRLLIRRIIQPKGQILMEWDDFGKPVIINYAFEVSISHCKDMVAVIVGDSVTGIDIEQKTDKIGRIAHKFLNSAEKEFIEEQKALEYQLVIWAAKETVFKYVGGGGIDFRQHLHVKPFVLQEKGVFDMQYTKKKVEDHLLHYEWIEDHILTYCL